MHVRSPAVPVPDGVRDAVAADARGHSQRRPAVCALLAAAPLALAFAPFAHAAEPPGRTEPVDLDFLEFLGSDDDADPELREYLLQQPAAPRKAVTATPPAGKPAPGTGSTSR